MNLLTLLEMAAAGHGDRPALCADGMRVTPAQLRARAYAGAKWIQESKPDTVLFMGENGLSFPVALFAAAAAGVPLLPLNYRLAPEQLDAAVAMHGRVLLIADDARLADLPNVVRSIGTSSWVDLTAALAAAEEPDEAPVDPDVDDVALLLMTSGTTSAPKSAVLRHRHLASYVLNSVEFGSSDEDEAMIVSVPPYHIAAVANLLSNLYSGRRIVYLDKFTAADWLETVNRERVTNAMVVPTMLSRIVDAIEQDEAAVPASLRMISYGGAPLAPKILERALRLLPDAGFVNAYGLTETSSSIAVLGPEDHREAFASDDPLVRARLGSVGRPLPAVTIQIRDVLGAEVPIGTIGLIFVKGPQVAGEYRGTGSVTDADGWFPTKDEGYLDADGFLFVRGRSDDTIIRGGENIAPAEIETVLHKHDGVAEVAVVGIPDEEWGQRIAAFVVRRPNTTVTAEELQDYVRSHLRSSKTPDTVQFLVELPHTPTGKILRRELVSQTTTPAWSTARP